MGISVRSKLWKLRSIILAWFHEGFVDRLLLVTEKCVGHVHCSSDLFTPRPCLSNSTGKQWHVIMVGF